MGTVERRLRIEGEGMERVAKEGVVPIGMLREVRGRSSSSGKQDCGRKERRVSMWLRTSVCPEREEKLQEAAALKMEEVSGGLSPSGAGTEELLR